VRATATAMLIARLFGLVLFSGTLTVPQSSGTVALAAAAGQAWATKLGSAASARFGAPAAAMLDSIAMAAWRTADLVQVRMVVPCSVHGTMDHRPDVGMTARLAGDGRPSRPASRRSYRGAAAGLPATPTPVPAPAAASSGS